MSEDDIHNLSLDISNQILNLDIWSNRVFHLFLSIDGKKEVRTEYILQILQGRDKDIVLSRSDFKKTELNHFLLTDQTVLKVNCYGIPEPQGNGFEVDAKKLDVVFIPLLAIDKKGNRVGYGKGFYDRFLEECRVDAIKIGISFFKPVDSTIIPDPTDIPMDFLVTPQKIYDFRN